MLAQLGYLLVKVNLQQPRLHGDDVCWAQLARAPVRWNVEWGPNPGQQRGDLLLHRRPSGGAVAAPARHYSHISRKFFLARHTLQRLEPPQSRGTGCTGPHAVQVHDPAVWLGGHRELRQREALLDGGRQCLAVLHEDSIDRELIPTVLALYELHRLPNPARLPQAVKSIVESQRVRLTPERLQRRENPLGVRVDQLRIFMVPTDA
mmetsp:Transcript_11263/g.41242  ORF Transcript_11263/g.41242 Transcript_11263/m.41242 type:complete len:206 (-) Transcript_11263:850-1467(-)